MSAFGAWYARERFGVTVHQSTLDAVGFPCDTFDYVLQKDLLEHVTHPRRHLLETCRIMRTGARLRLITPNGDADIRPLRDATDASRADRLPVLGQGHLSFFSRPQLIRLLEDTGFRLLRFRNIGVRRGVRSLGVVPGWRSRPRLMARDALVDRAEAVARQQSQDGDDGRMDRAARIDTEIARRHRRLRGWTSYFHYRRLLKRFDSFPASMTIGQDFDLLVQKA